MILRRALFVMMLSAVPGWTQNAPDPEQIFADWRVLCDGDQCQMWQTASAGDEGPQVFLISISHDDKTGRDYAVMTVPVGVYLAPGIELRVDNRAPFKVLYEVCDQTGCHAGFALHGAVLGAFRKGLDARVRVWTAKERAVEFPVSLSGFTKAHQYFRTEGAG